MVWENPEHIKGSEALIYPELDISPLQCTMQASFDKPPTKSLSRICTR